MQWNICTFCFMELPEKKPVIHRVVRQAAVNFSLK